jgi:hypothetical protein
MLPYARLQAGERYLYSVRSDGQVLRTNKKNYAETVVKPYSCNGKRVVAIRRKKYNVDALVAKNFLADYKPQCIIQHLNGDEWDCDKDNLRIISRADFNARATLKSATEGKHLRPLIIDGVYYPSVRAAARGVYVTLQTLKNYLAGRHKCRCLAGMDIRDYKDRS